ncbi:3790_t:CDS:1, partial [Entrophospora sp. SA101]
AVEILGSLDFMEYRNEVPKFPLVSTFLCPTSTFLDSNDFCSSILLNNNDDNDNVEPKCVITNCRC